jgi:hypothetical protein
MNDAEKRALNELLNALYGAARAEVRYAEMALMLKAMGDAVYEVNRELGSVRVDVDVAAAMTSQARWLRERTSELLVRSHLD